MSLEDYAAADQVVYQCNIGVVGVQYCVGIALALDKPADVGVYAAGAVF